MDDNKKREEEKSEDKQSKFIGQLIGYAILAAVLAFTNPPPEKHYAEIRKVVLDKSRQEHPIATAMVKGGLGEAIIDSMIDSSTRYKDFKVCSLLTTTGSSNSSEEQILSFGILGMVFCLAK